MTVSRTARFIVAAAGAIALSALPGVASAQTSVFGLKIEGDVELGGRVYADRPAPEKRAKLEEYRDLSQQPFGAFGIRLFRPDESYSTELRGLNVGQDDQEFSLESGRPGLWRFNFDWDQIPHVYSTNARLLANEPSRGVFTLPTPRPGLSAYNSGRRLDDISQRWDTGHFEFKLTPTPFLDLEAEYTRIEKHGDKPFSLAMGSPGGNFVEVLEPVDQTIHDFRLKAAWSGAGWQLQASYALSIFENALSSVTADNPCFPLAACGGDAAGPERGRISLAPDNMAHTFSLGGGVNLPMRTRVTGNLSYSLRLQDDDFLPHTINPAIQSPLLALPRQSLDGMVGIFLLNLRATTNPLPPLTISGGYRLYDFDDMTDELVFPGHVVNDRPPVVDEARRATRFPYTKHNADVDARWRFSSELATTVGAGWERWDRVFHREVPNSDEYFGKLAVDASPLDWLLARLTYKPSFRRIDEYNTFAHLAHTVIEDITPDAQAQGQSPLLRKFDEADRDRQRVDLLVQLTPTDVVSISPTVSYWYDDYYNSTLGLQDAENWSAGFDVGWTPMPWLSASAGYVYEKVDQQQRSRSRPVTGTTTFDFPDFDWVSNNVDIYHTIRASLKATLIPEILDLIFEASYSRGNSEIKTRNPLTPTSGTAAQRTTATAKPFPDLENTLIDLGASVRYRFAKAWSLSLGYLFEKFEQTNFRTDTLNPFNAGVTSIYLGNDLKDYTAHIFTLALGYHFE
jgi:MtrB/PioB family decaheme-associated outer membrane protein